MQLETFNSEIIKQNPRAAAFFRKQQLDIFKSTDRLFVYLMPLQWVAGMIIALLIAPLSWEGTRSSINSHIWGAVFVGGMLTSLPVFLALKHPGERITRYSIAVSQILISSLLIHITGGRIETHFHVFGSLAFLAFYRDWRVLIPATIVTTADHILRGWLYPQSIYGIVLGGEWRWLEHAAWVIFEDIFLIVLCQRSVKEMWKIAVHTTALNDSEVRYRTVVEQMSEGIFLLEPESFNVIECNEAFARLLAYETIDEVKNLNLSDFDASKESVIGMMTGSDRHEKSSITTEKKYRKKDGSFIHVEITGRCITYNENIAYCINARDITERKRVEAEMMRLALVAQKTQNSVIITDPQGAIEWVNEGFTRTTGYRFEEVIGKSGQILHGKETNAETTQMLRDALKQQKPFEGEIFNYRKDGKGYWVSISLMPIYKDDCTHKGFIAIEMDITERKAMEKALREASTELETRVTIRTTELLEANLAMLTEVAERKRAEQELSHAKEFLARVIDTIPSLIFVKNRAHQYTLANRALADMFGAEPKDLIGKTDLDYSPDKVTARQYQLDDIEVFESSQEKFILEEKFTDINGNVRWLQTVKRPLFGESGVESVLGIATDVTERKILEGQLRQAQKLESIGQLAAGIAHEINTPTQYVGDNTRFVQDAFADISSALEKYEMLLKAARNKSINSELIAEITDEIDAVDLPYLLDEVPNAINQSLEGVSRIAKIVQSMKDFAHPGSKEKKAVDLNKAIESTITVARNEWKYVADMETVFDPNLPPVPCLLGELNQVILNIVINASHAIADAVDNGSRGKGKITVKTTKVSDDWAEVSIADTGIGIPAEIQNKIFDPFFTTKQVGKGSGQGLAISHTVVVEQHKGKLTFETEQGKGTTFIIQLPLNSSNRSNNFEINSQ